MKRSPSAAAMAALALAAACSSEGTARLGIRLTDAPGDGVGAAVVTITRISLQGEHGEVVLSDETTTIDLLSLANEAATLVEDAVVPTGRYGQLRFRVSGGYVEVASPDGDGTLVYATSPDYEGLPAGTPVAGLLKLPSWARSGLKVTLPGDALVLEAESKILLVDFDVAQSFGHDAGGSGSWVMSPVIRGADLTLSGDVVATLALAPDVTLPPPATLAGFRAVLTNEAGSAETLPFVSVEGGPFTAAFRFLLPGRYTLDVVGPVGISFETAPVRPAEILVGGGTAPSVAFRITSASAP